MKLYILLVIFAFSSTLACKSKSSRKASKGEDANSEEIDADARPLIAETEFVISDISSSPLEGTTKRAEGGTEASGTVSGTWDKSMNPIYITSDVLVGPDKILIIKAGVSIIFTGKYRISIEGGQLKVDGTAAEKVTFVAENKTEGWAGIRICPDPECRQEELKGKIEIRHAIFQGARKDNMDPNDATWRRGGAIYLRGTATSLIEDSDFKDNYAQERGGAVELIADNRNLIFRRNTFTGNKNDAGSNGGGGALHITHGRNITIENCTFTGNESKGQGGAIYMLDSAGIVLKGNTFTSNVSAKIGGAIRCDGHASMISVDASNVMKSNVPNDFSCEP